MTSSEFGGFTLSLLLLIAVAHVCGWVFTRLRQPRVAGEILAGILLGPSVLGRFWPDLSNAIFHAGDTSPAGLQYQAVIGFLFNLGLVLLMFSAGAEAKGLFRRNDARQVAWLAGVGAGLPFAMALAIAPWLPLGAMIGQGGHDTPLLLIIAVSVSVTSIPVISKIFHDLGITHTRFAHIVLGVAVLEDIALWGVLAVATALAAARELPNAAIATHLLITVAYFVLGLSILPSVVRRVTASPWNVLRHMSPVAYAVVLLLAYTALAAALDVNLVFAAFIAGYSVSAQSELADASATLNKVSFAVFIPVYFAGVGYQLDLTRTLSIYLLAGFLGLSSLAKIGAAGLGGRLAGFPWTDSLNLSLALNARGGPGIVIATVAYEAEIINAAFYTTLVLTAILTSQVAGAWLEFLLRRGRPLLRVDGAAPAASA